MPKVTVDQKFDASSERVFDVIHDYDRRLDWDTLLSEAYLEPPFETAAKGTVSLCRSRKIFGGIAIRTVYVSFERGKVAAVKMVNRPPFFETFAASIRHIAVSEQASKVEYKFSFTAKPRFLRPLLQPIMLIVLRWETKKRLRALRDYMNVNGGER